jgi:TonB family protein
LEEATPVPTVAPPPPAPPPPPAEVERPVPIDVHVDYPEGASGSHTVVVDLTVQLEGQVSDVAVVSGDSPFAEATLRAAGGWRFSPGRRNGVAVPTRLRFAVAFSPQLPPQPSDAEKPPTALPSDVRAKDQPPRKPPGQTGVPEARGDVDEPVEVLVEGERPEASSSLGQAEVRELPGAFGDAFRAVEILPGVVPIVSGLPYFYVRGAPPGNVGYFFDGVRVPLLYHFAAGPAILHPAFVGKVDLYPGAYPSRYGRFAGGIVAGEMQEPEYRVRGEASIRIIDSGAMLEVPFADGRASVMAGGRISYTGLLISLLVPELTVTYWDYQSRTRIPLDEDDALEILLFGSGDYVSEESYDYETMRREDTTLVDMGFHRLDVRWQRRLDGGEWQTALMLGRDRTGLEDELELTNTLLGLRSELDRQLDDAHRLRAGVDVLFESLAQDFPEREASDEARGMASPVDGMMEPAPGQAPPMPPPGPEVTEEAQSTPSTSVDGAPEQAQFEEESFEASPEPGDSDFDLGVGDRIDVVAGAYVDVVMDAAPGVEFTPGLRLDVFTSRGDYALGVDPRLRVRYQLSADVALIHSLGLAHQMPSFPIPVPGLSPTLKGGLQRAVQHSVGAETKLPEDLTLSTTVFHNVFLDMTDLIGVPDAQNTGFRSLGRAYGFELLLRRPMTRKLSGFVSYTASRSERYIARYAGPSTFDRTHVLNVAASYDLGRNWRFGNRVVFYTGIPAILGASNPDPSLRTPPFWRLDWRLQKRWLYPWGYTGLVFEVLNTTLNKEVVSIDCSFGTCREEAIGPVTIPSIGFEGAF